MIFRAAVSFACLLCMFMNAAAQPPQFRLSQQSLLKVEKITSAEKKLRAYKKCFHRDSIRFNRKLNRYYKYYSDSLRIALNSNIERVEASSHIPNNLSDSSQLATLTDSVSLFNTLKNGRDQYLKSSTVKLASSELGQIQSTDLTALKDQYATNYKSPELEKYVDNKYVSALPDEAGLQSAQKNLLTPSGTGNIIPADFNPGTLTDSARIKEMINKEKEELAMKYINENPALLNGVQKKMSRLMRKYSIIPNSNDLSTAMKRTSMAGKSFKQRLFIGGNFQTPSWKPLCIDFSPLMGYR